MKQYYLTTSPSGIGLIPKENMPVEPEEGICSEEPRLNCFDKNGCLCAKEWKPYREALQRTISEAVPVGNKQDYQLRQMILMLPGISEITDGQVYGPFTGEYEIKEVLSPGWVPSYNDPDNINGHPNAEPMQVAILSEPEEKEQSQSQKQSTWYPEWRKIVDAVLEPSKHPICRDCADGDGTCDIDNLPCDPTDRVIEVFRRLKQEKEPVKESQEDESLNQAALRYAKNHSHAPDKETPDWIITDFKAGVKWEQERKSLESQDVWNEAQLTVKRKLGTYSNDLVSDLARWAIEALKEHFTITRK